MGIEGSELFVIGRHLHAPVLIEVHGPNAIALVAVEWAATGAQQFEVVLQVMRGAIGGQQGVEIFMTLPHADIENVGCGDRWFDVRQMTANGVSEVDNARFAGLDAEKLHEVLSGVFRDANDMICALHGAFFEAACRVAAVKNPGHALVNHVKNGQDHGLAIVNGVG